METVSQLSGISLHYARESQHPYGTIGRPQSFTTESNFKDLLTTCFSEVFAECPLGKPKVITCAGIYNPQHANPNSQHRSGKAFDFDAAFWDDFTMITKKFHSYKELYLGIESFLRVHFGIVLNYYFNQKHEDHWHLDNSVSVDFRTNYKSSVLHLQLVLLHIYGKDVEVDGQWGPQTENATKAVLSSLGLSGRITTIPTYKSFLRKTGKLAFLKFEQTKTPLQLLNSVYEIVADLNIDYGSSSSIVEALNDFRNHPDSDAWLQSNAMVSLDLDALIDQVT